MPKRGKKYMEAVKAFDKSMVYDVPEAMDLVVKTSKAKFDETIEAHIRLGVDGRHADQQVRGAIVLPNGTGKTKKVLVFAKGPKAAEAEAAGAEFVGAEEMAQKSQTEGWFDFDVVIATPDMMGVVGRLGKILGPKGLMPNPKSGTVTMDVEKAINEVKAGKVEYRLDKSNIIHTPIGKASFGAEKLEQNFTALMDAVIKAKLENAEAAVVIDYMGITVAEADAMRKQLREADVDYTVYKNTLVKRAIEGTKYEGLADALAGPSALAISQTDATAPARVLNKVMEEFKKMEFKAGVIEGELFDAAGIQAIADIPSRDELIAKFMGSIQSPIANFARVINQIAEQKGEGAEA